MNIQKKLLTFLFSLLLSGLCASAFTIEDRVQCTANLNVRATPSTSGTLITTEANGSRGIIIDGPQSANGYTWWKVQWDNGYTGWSVDYFTLVSWYLLNIASSNPNSSVSISVSPNDFLHSGSGSTFFSRYYDSGTSVTLTAPSTASGNNFSKWTRNGVDYSVNSTITVAVLGTYTMTAVYIGAPLVTHTLTVASSNPSSGAGISGNQTDNNGNYGGVTPYTRVFNHNSSVSFNASSTAGGNNFQKWQKDGVDLTTSTTASLTMDGNHTITAVYISAPTVYTLNIASSNPNSGVYIYVGPNDTLGRADGTTAFSRTFYSGSSITLIAPLTAGGNNFQKWQRDGVDLSFSTTVTFPMSASYTLMAVYVPAPPVTHVLTVASSNPNGGVSVSGNQPDNTGNYGGTTSFTRTFSHNASVSFNAPTTAGGNIFQKWQRDGVDLTNSTTATVIMDSNHTLTAAYGALAPTVQTLATSLKTATSARLNGYINPNGFTTTAYFQYGTSASYGSTTPSGVFGTTSQNIGLALSNLTPNTVYHYRIVAYNSAGTNSGSDVAFQTLSLGIASQPQSQATNVGANVTFTVVAMGVSPFTYQWYFNNQSLAGQTGPMLTLNSVDVSKAGSYFVIVSNAYDSITSGSAILKLVGDPANGTPAAQIDPPYCPAPSVNVDSLVLITHGVEPFYDLGRRLYMWGDISWINSMSNAVRLRAPSNWEVRPLDWTTISQTTEPGYVARLGEIYGRLYGNALGQQRNWKHIHLIGHSAGASVIEAIATELKALPLANRPIIHETFLDPFLGWLHEWQFDFGVHSDWSDNYFAANGFSLWTNAKLPHAHNVDVSWLDTANISYVTNYWSPSGMADTTPATAYEQQVAVGVQAYVTSSHGWPHDFYQASITNGPPNAAGYGFPLSEEINGWNNLASYPVNNDPTSLNGQVAQYQHLTPPQTGLPLPFNLFPNAKSSSGVNFNGNNGATLFNALSQSISPNRIHTLAGSSATNAPAWLSVGLAITNAVNFVQFDATFTDANSAQGLLTVYWDTNRIGMVDERVASTNLQTYRFALPATVTNNVYVLGFRLDSFGSALSSIAITNVATGFVGVDQPITLRVALVTNNTPILRLTGASNYNYVVQSSTNLVNWTPTALLVNSNGTTFFADRTATNSSARFYRAVMP